VLDIAHAAALYTFHTRKYLGIFGSWPLSDSHAALPLTTEFLGCLSTSIASLLEMLLSPCNFH
jgi:hypothetical protein